MRCLQAATLAAILYVRYAAAQDGGADGDDGDETGGPWMMSDRLIVAHATFGCLSWLLVSPIAILLAQFGRHTFSWFLPHAVRVFR